MNLSVPQLLNKSEYTSIDQPLEAFVFMCNQAYLKYTIFHGGYQVYMWGLLFTFPTIYAFDVYIKNNFDRWKIHDSLLVFCLKIIRTLNCRNILYEWSQHPVIQLYVYVHQMCIFLQSAIFSILCMLSMHVLPKNLCVTCHT